MSDDRRRKLRFISGTAVEDGWTLGVSVFSTQRAKFEAAVQVGRRYYSVYWSEDAYDKEDS